MKAVIYARYSSDSQREESIEGQLRECTEYAERNGITVFRSYIDRALSARTADRPEFQNMIKDSEQKLFDVVLIWKLDRFSRDRYDSAHYKRILKKNGVKVVSVKENISVTSGAVRGSTASTPSVPTTYPSGVFPPLFLHLSAFSFCPRCIFSDSSAE